MEDLPNGWEKDKIGHLNADGKSIEYINEKLQYRAIVEAMHDEQDGELQYYTVIFDISEGRPWPTVEPHQIYINKDDAKNNLYDLMNKYT